MLKWKDDYLIGVENIDDQHKKLFEIAEKGFDLLKNDMCIDKYDRIILVLEELKDYAVYHFKSEEAYMLSIGYKRFISHKVEHDEFIEKVTNADLKKIDIDQDAYLMSLLEFIINWTCDHILKNDKLITSLN